MPRQIPDEVVVIGAPDHPLGQRTIALYANGSAQMLSEAYGLESRTTHADGRALCAEMREIFERFDTGRPLAGDFT